MITARTVRHEYNSSDLVFDKLNGNKCIGEVLTKIHEGDVY